MGHSRPLLLHFRVWISVDCQQIDEELIRTTDLWC